MPITTHDVDRPPLVARAQLSRALLFAAFLLYVAVLVLSGLVGSHC